METWDELIEEKDSDREDEDANLALMALTLYDSESESGLGSESDDKDREYPKLSQYDLIHDSMSLCQDQARRIKVVKKHLEFLEEELKSSKETVETLERNLVVVKE